MNLRNIPARPTRSAQRFTLLPMPDDSPFKPSWWYRTEFELPARLRRAHALAALRRHQLPREHLVQRHAHRPRATRSSARSAATSSTSRALRAAGRAERARRRGDRPRARTTSPSCGWTGTRRPPTRTWASGATSTSPTAARSRCATRTSSRRSTCPSLERAHAHRHAPRSWNTTDRAGRPASCAARSRTSQFSQAVTLGPRERTTVRFTPDGRARRSTIAEAAALVAVPHGRAEPLHARPRRRGGGRRLRPPGGRASASSR